jgi:hypothetical protein
MTDEEKNIPALTAFICLGNLSALIRVQTSYAFTVFIRGYWLLIPGLVLLCVLRASVADVAVMFLFQELVHRHQPACEAQRPAAADEVRDHRGRQEL